MMGVLIYLETIIPNVGILVTVLVPPVPVPVPVPALVPVRVPVECLPVPKDRQNAHIAGFAIWIMVETMAFVNVR